MLIRKTYQSVIAIALCLFMLSAYAFQPMVLTQAKDQVDEYYLSGQHEVEVQQIVNQAKAFLQLAVTQNSASPHPKKLAMVLDIDDTSLNNFNQMRQWDFASNDGSWDAIQKNTNIPANLPVLELYNYARQLGVTVFFITARPDVYTDSTKKALENAGYKGYAGLYLITKQYDKVPYNVFKTAIRKQISDSGYDIVVNMGDQYSDLVGGYSRQIYKLPNYMYGSY